MAEDKGLSDAVTTTDTIPEGGGAIRAAAGVVVTQPAPGVSSASSAPARTGDAQCGRSAAGTINCFCHGSRFRITDGSVAGRTGPDRCPAAVVVRDERISLG